MKHTTNSMRGNAALWCILAYFLLLLPASAGAVERNYLTSQFTEAEVSAALVRGQAWVPFPAYTDRAGWDSLVGTRRETLIKRGEKRLDYQWQMNVATEGKINLWSNAQVKAMGEYFADAYIGNGWVVNFAERGGYP